MNQSVPPSSAVPQNGRTLRGDDHPEPGTAQCDAATDAPEHADQLSSPQSGVSQSGTTQPGTTQPGTTRSGVSPAGEVGGDARTTAPAGRRRAESKQRLPLWLDTVLTMVVALVIAVLVKTFLIQPFFIPSASMNPTLLQDDKILVSKLSPGVFDLERGDVIVFEDPGEWIPGDATENPTPRVRLMMVLSLVGLAPDPSQDHLVKRLIGMPGDRVVCESEGSVLQVNGTEIDEPYINPETSACQTAFDVTVPAGKVWVMGDNRYASADSAWHHTHGGDGFVAESDITGRAEVVFWPASRWSGLGGGDEAFADVPDTP